LNIKDINTEIKSIKKKLDEIAKIENLIINNATTYEILFELDLYSEKENKMRGLVTVQDVKSYLIDPTVNVELNKNGNMPINQLEKEYNYEYNTIIKALQSDRKESTNRMGYLEFIKKKPRPKEVKDRLGYEEDLDDFIKFLDNKYEEWENNKEVKTK